MLKQRHNRQAGFTLVEVMMASLILVVGFVGMIEAVAISSKMMDSARRQTLAAQIITHEMEKLRLLPWQASSGSYISGLPAGPTAITIDNRFREPNDTGTDPTIAGATFSLSRSVSDLVAGSLREVTFTVTWVVTTSRLKSDGTRLTFSYTRVNTAYFGKYGLNLAYQRS